MVAPQLNKLKLTLALAGGSMRPPEVFVMHAEL